MNDKVYYLDTETTGFGDDAEVIQIGILDHAGVPLIDTYVQCQDGIPEEAIAVHHITPETLKDAPTYPEIHDHLCDVLSKPEYVVIYNSSFDVRLLRQAAERYGLELPEYKTRCAMKEYANMHFDGEYIKLSEAASIEGFNLDSVKAHDAINDCTMTRFVWLSMQKEQESRKKRKAKAEELKALKMELVPTDANDGNYTDYGQVWRPKGYKTLSQLRKRDLKHYEFAGTCCSSFGDKGYLFKPKED